MILPFFVTERSIIVNSLVTNCKDLICYYVFLLSRKIIQIIQIILETNSIQMFNNSLKDVKKIADFYLYNIYDIITM